jgi:hypothetical protein
LPRRFFAVVQDAFIGGGIQERKARARVGPRDLASEGRSLGGWIEIIDGVAGILAQAERDRILSAWMGRDSAHESE